MVSPATAFSIPWLIDLQALACAPQLPLSAPSLVTNRVRAAAVFESMQVNVNAAVTMAAVPTLSMVVSPSCDLPAGEIVEPSQFKSQFSAGTPVAHRTS